MHSRMRISRLIAISAGISLITLAVGAATSYAVRPFHLETFHLSSLQDDYTNPDGYLVPLIGTFIGQLLLIGAAVGFGRRLRQTHPVLAYVASTLLLTAVVLLSVNSIHEYLGIEDTHVHAVLAHIGFGLMILAHISFIYLAERDFGNRGRFNIRNDLRIALFSFVVVVSLFLIPLFTGVDVTQLVFGFSVDLILGLCEVIYLTIFFVSLWRTARTLEV